MAIGSWNGIGFTAWDGVAITSWNGTAISTGSATPAFSSAEVQNDGVTFLVNWTGNCTRGAGYNNNQWTLANAAGLEGTLGGIATPTLAYVSGDGTNQWTMQVNVRTINLAAVETVTVSYAQPGGGNGIEATSGGADIANFTNSAVTNNSTQQTYTSRHSRITPTGGIQGIGWDGTFNNAVQARARVTTLRNELGFAFVPTRVGLSGHRSAGPNNQEVKSIIYQPAAPGAISAPDDRLGSVVGGRFSDDFPASAPAAQVTWDHSGVGQIADDDYYHVGAYVDALFTPLGVGYMGFSYTGTPTAAGTGVYVRNNNTTPASPNDAANWTLYNDSGDTTQELDVQVWSSP